MVRVNARPYRNLGERLMRFATALGQDVVIEIRPRARAKGVGRVRVVGAA